MIKIFVYIQDEEQKDKVNHIADGLFGRLKCNYSIEDFLRKREQGILTVQEAKKYDIFILDIDDPVALKIAGCVRSVNFYSSIIFLSRTMQKLQPALIFRPSAYLQIPFQDTALEEKLLVLYKEQKLLNRYFIMKNHGKIERIPHSRIEYFENCGRNVHLHITRVEKIYEFTAKLDDIQETLPTSLFVRCHQSFLVNLEHVKALDTAFRQFVLFSGKAIDISRRSYKSSVMLFNEYLQ